MYQLAFPSVELTPFIENYWSVYAPVDQPFDLTVDVYVDARADLILNFGVPYLRKALGQPYMEIKDPNLDAQRKTPIQIIQKGLLEIAGVRFHTGGLGAFFGQELYPFNDKLVEPETIWGPSFNKLLDGVREAGSDIERVKVLFDGFFLERLIQDKRYQQFHEIKREIEGSKGLLSMDEITQAHGIQAKQLDRIFLRFLGFGPKYFSLINRFRGVLARLMSAGEHNLGEIAAEFGYYDQSHLVKDFKRFAGGIPQDFKGFFPKDAPTDFSPNLVQFLQDDWRH